MGHIVPRKFYVNSSAWSSTFWQIAAMTGTGAAGFLFEFYQFKNCYYLCSFLIFMGLCSLLMIQYTHQVVEVKKNSIMLSIKDGLSYVKNDPRIYGAMALDMFAVLFGGATALLPIFAEEILQVGPRGLGILRASPSVGAMLMAFLMTKYPPIHKTGKKLLLSIFMFGVSIFFFALSKNFILSVCCLFLSGVFDSVSVIIRSTIIQTFTPDKMRGRVSSVSSLFISSSNEIGAFESGMAARLLGLIPSIIFGTTMTFLIVISTKKLNPKLASLELRDHI